MLGELAPEGETTETHGAVEEEEGSSSTPGKEDIEDGRVVGVVRLPKPQLSKPKFV